MRADAQATFLAAGACAIARADDLVPGALVEHRDRLLDRRVADHQEAPALHVAAIGGVGAGLQDLAEQRIGHRVRLQPAHRARGAHDFEQVGIGHLWACLSREGGRGRGKRAGCGRGRTDCLCVTPLTLVRCAPSTSPAQRERCTNRGRLTS